MKMTYKDILLCSEDDIKTYSNINENTDGKYISPAIYIAQKSDLEGVIGTKLVRKLQTLVGKNEIDNYENEHYKELLDDYVTDFLIYATIVRLIPIVQFKIGNAGNVISSDEKLINLSFEETFSLKDFYQNQADYLKYRLQKFLIKNHNNYKELSSYSIDEMKANLKSAASCAINI